MPLARKKITELGPSNHVIYVIHYIRPGVDKNLGMAPAVKLHISHTVLYSSSWRFYIVDIHWYAWEAGTLRYVAPAKKKRRSAEFLRIGLAEDKRLQRFLKAYLHGEHLLVICRPLATFGAERRAQRRLKGEKKKEEKQRKSEREGMRWGQEEMKKRSESRRNKINEDKKKSTRRQKLSQIIRTQRL